MSWPECVLTVYGATRRPPSLYWRGHCPLPAHSHSDRSPSLSFWMGRNGSLIMGCHKGCDKREVLAHYGLTMKDLMPPERRNGAPSDYFVPRRLVDTFDYIDGHGEVVFQKLRYEPKCFCLRHPGPDGGWVWNMNGVLPVLYRLPELLASNPKAPVFFAEGERKVHKLEAMGFTATCPPFGADMKAWHDNYSRPLCGRRVVFLPDNDAPGHKLMAWAAFHVMMAEAASVRVVELPGLAERGDIIDWAKANSDDPDLLIAICKAAPEWAPLVSRPM